MESSVGYMVYLVGSLVYIYLCILVSMVWDMRLRTEFNTYFFYDQPMKTVFDYLERLIVNPSHDLMELNGQKWVLIDDRLVLRKEKNYAWKNAVFYCKLETQRAHYFRVSKCLEKEMDKMKTKWVPWKMLSFSSWVAPTK